MAPRTRRIDDAGQKIGGARKDLWRDRRMTVEDLATMNAEERVALVSKDLIWPSPDYAALLASGVDVKVLASIKVIRDAVPVRPDMGARVAGSRDLREPEAIHASYVNAVGICRDIVMAARTEADIKAAYSEFVRRVGYTRESVDESLYLMRSVTGRRDHALFFGGNEARRADALVASGWPSKTTPVWEKGVAFSLRRADMHLMAIDKKTGKLLVAAKTAEEVEAFLKTRHEEGKAGKHEEPKRPHLAKLERVGGRDVRQGRDIQPEDFLKAFGFRGVEFGLWLPDSERGEVLNLAYDALHDLADAMGVDPSAISLGGRLAIAFGARGSGRAAATYEASRTVLNVTRLAGAGSVAHEYGHALDHWAGEVDRPSDGRGHVRSGSGWRDWGTTPVESRLTNLEPAQAKAWAAAMHAVSERPRTKAEAIDALEATIAQNDTTRAGERVRLERYLEQTPEARRDRSFVRKMGEWLEGSERRAKQNALRLEELRRKPEDASFGNTTTAYALEAAKLSGKSGDYWKRPNEMFARAFESAIFDRLAERGIRSDYLVHGVEGDRYVDPDKYKGNPYPSGGERERIVGAILDVVEAMRPRVQALAANPVEENAPAM